MILQNRTSGGVWTAENREVSVQSIPSITQVIRTSIFMHPLRHAALAVVTAGVCSLSLLAIAQAGPTGNPPAVHKQHFYRAPALVHLSGAAEAWMSGRCDGPYQSEFPPCISAFPAAAPNYHYGWHPGPTFNVE